MEPPPLPERPGTIRRHNPKAKKSQQTPEEKLAELKNIVTNLPDNRDIDMVHEEWKNRPVPPPDHVLPPVSPKPIRKPDLENIPVGKPHWQVELRKHLILVEQGDVIPYPTSTDASKIRAQFEEIDDGNGTYLEPKESDLETDLENVVLTPGEEPLPRLFQALEEFKTPGSSIVIELNERLLMHYTAVIYRVHASVDADGAEFWLPIHAKQTYTRYPMGEYV